MQNTLLVNFKRYELEKRARSRAKSRLAVFDKKVSLDCSFTSALKIALPNGSTVVDDDYEESDYEKRVRSATNYRKL